MLIEKVPFEFVLKNKVRFGPGIVKELPSILQEFGFERIGFVIDKNVYEHFEPLPKLVKDLEKKFQKIVIHLYSQKFEPTYEFLDVVKNEFKQGTQPLVDCIVGIGGGSSMDTAKVVALLCTNHGPAISYRGFPKNLNKPLPMITTPSTAGTGSELVYYASIIDSDTKVKMGVNDPNNYPILALLDPEVVAIAPKSVAISSGCDALIHALESFVSIKSNEVTRIFSKQAFGLIINTLPKLVNDMRNLEHWSKMQWGAYLAMVGLSNASSGPSGALSYYLGCHFNVPHGIAGAVFIGKITRINHELEYYDYSDLYSLLEAHNPLITDKRERSELVVNAVESFLEVLEIPGNLSDFGVTKKDYPGFFKYSTEDAKKAFDFNPVQYSKEVISQLLQNLIFS